MKVLWIVNTTFPEALLLLTGSKNKLKTSGGWMLGAADALINNQEVDLYIASSCNLVQTITRLVGNKIVYYLIPGDNFDVKYDSRQEPLWKTIRNEINPDVVHIHGTEYAHSLSFIKATGTSNVVVSIQGLKHIYARHYLGGIDYKTIYKNITFHDIVKGNLIAEMRMFRYSGEIEKKVLKNVKHIIGRTSWDRACSWAINPSAKYHFCNEILRNEFYCDMAWSYSKCKRHSIFLSQGAYALKGLCQVLDALPIVLSHYPDIEVRIAGNDITFSKGLYGLKHFTGYGKIVKKKIARYNLHNHISFLGPLDAEQMRDEYLSANLFICPSSIENSPNSLGEAQILGTPCIASYVGGIMDMMVGNEDCMYRFGEIEVLAYKICEVFKNEDNQVSMIEQARKRHDPIRNSEQLFSVYKNIVENSNI